MTTETLVKKLDKEVKLLRRDVAAIKGAIVGVEGDVEGIYRREFIARVLKRSRQKPAHRFRDSASFLKHVRSRQE